MSILLDAVSRSKQEQHDAEFDPITAPRPAIVEKNHYGILLVVIAALLVIVVAALGYLAWQNVSSKTDNAQAEKVATAVPVKAEAKVTAAPEVALAGKVTLPRPRQLPAEQPAQVVQSPAVTQMNLANTNRSETMADSTADSTSANSANEPIMLGANANDKGLAMLRQLKAEQQDDVQADSSVVNSVQSSAPAQADAVNDELMNRFQAALSEIEKRNAMSDDGQPVDQVQPATPTYYPSYGELPAGLQLQVPEFNITAHLYATNPQKRWINVDGKELQQGDKIKQKLTVVEIRPNDVVLAIQGTRFRVPAI
ncbi:general secretion pathway protein GspB [Shewanella mangrovi]|uniref:general secretion pathway protein GspB n=1 Tax=Shewanella mangrovi TaxID=1515746 RepID=UPI000691C4B6|nr:general secretion pathway protein GspB [Shewanella mangrovi]